MLKDQAAFDLFKQRLAAFREFIQRVRKQLCGTVAPIVIANQI